jgi:Fanconi anemia group J protein
MKRSEKVLPCRKGKDEGDDGDTSFLPGFAFKFALWCLNPAVAFKPMAATAHSVVLTSGTLAPLDGFASEVSWVGCC